ncbi:MAG TPA: MFS transporter [Roseiflexaceae bacterium]|nr:MFS transporter [Roseiflexaceae bacterium]
MSRRIILFAAFAFAYFLSNFFRATNAVIAGDLTRDLLLTAADLGLMTSLFYAGFAATQLPLGVALDRIGPRFTTASLLLVSVGGCLIFSVADSFAMVALGRTMLGIGMGGCLMGALKAFGVWYAPERVATITSLMVGMGAMGGLGAATPLAWINVQIGWRAVFGWGALIIFCSALAIMLLVRNAPPGSAPPTTAAAGGDGFGRIFREPIFWRIVPLNFFLIGSMLAVQTLWGGPFLFDVLDLPPIEAGNLLLGLSGGIAFGYISCGWLADRFGIERNMLIVTPISTICLALIAIAGAALPPILLGLLFAGFGYGGAFNLVLLAQIRREFPEQMRGRAATALNMFGFGGAALIQWWMGILIAAFPRLADGRYPPIAYSTAFGVVALGMALSFLWYLPRRRAAVPRVAYSEVQND